MEQKPQKSDKMGSLQRSVEEDNQFFKQMIDLIPARIYFQYNVDAKERIIEDKIHRIKDNNLKTVGKSHKRGNKELSDKVRLKIANFDPSQPQTVSQIQEHLTKERTEEAETKSDSKKRKRAKTKEAEEGKHLKKRKEQNEAQLDEEVGSTSSLDELRNRIQQKIELLRAKRKALNTQDYIEKKRLRRTMSKMKHKMKKKTEKHMKAANTATNGPVQSADKNSSSKPIFNKEGKMVFSKFDFSDSGSSEKSAGAKGKDYKKLLQKIERDKEKLNELKEKDADAAKVAQEKATWKKMIQKAEGVKLKDNPELLKKSMKRKDTRIKKSKKDWSERQNSMDEKKKVKQDKRKANIDKKKKNRIDKKIKKAKKKGRILPGF